MAEGVTIELTDDEALVVFEFLASRDEADLRAVGADDGDLAALNALEAVLEAQLLAPLQGDYARVVAEARRRLRPDD